MTRVTYETTLEGSKLLAFGENIYFLQTPTGAAQSWLECRLKAKVLDALECEVELEFVVAPAPAPPREAIPFPSQLYQSRR